MKSIEIRKKFLKFFEDNQHQVLSGSDLLLENDPSLLFVNAGMNQFKKVFLGLEAPPAQNVVTIQKCLRVGGKHNDLEEVGTTPLHHTFFEMLGNFSFGGYFKERAIELSWKFLTQELKIPSEHLWVTVHHKDKDSYRIWRDQENIPEHKIYKLGDKDNFWQMGETGPCGYCSEIHYYKGENKKPDPSQFMEIWNLVFMEFQRNKEGSMEKLPVPCVDTGMGLERLCSLLQNKKSNYHTDLFKGIIEELNKYCDLKYDFEEELREESKKTEPKETQSNQKQPSEIQTHKKQSKQEREEIKKAFRVVADHSRTVSLLIADSIWPGNQKEHYVSRRILRRALYYSQKLQTKKNLLQEKSLLEVGAEKAIELFERATEGLKENVKERESFKEYERHFDFLPADKKSVKEDIRSEYQKFFNSLKEGEKRLEEIIEDEKNKTAQKAQSREKPKIDKRAVWHLYNTYGFPMDLTRLMAKERGWEAPTEEEMQKYLQEIIRKLETGLANQATEANEESTLYDLYDQFSKSPLNEIKSQSLTKDKKIEWTAYKQKEESGKILHIKHLKVNIDRNGSSISSFGPRSSDGPISEDEVGWVVMDKTCFYPEGGGPIGDKGWIETETGKALVLDCQKYMTMIAHKVKVLKGKEGANPVNNPIEKIKIGDKKLKIAESSLKPNQSVKMKVDKDFRQQIAISHSSTHLLNSALRFLFGDSISQAGSLVEPGRLRFDFTFDRPLTKKELSQIEEKVYESIERKDLVSSSHKSFSQAKEEGALYLKGEGYRQKEVRVIRMGDDTSLELCGGIHVENTGEVGHFKIVSEKGVQSGVRRIIAYTGALAVEWERLLVKQNHKLRGYLDSSIKPEKTFEETDKTNPSELKKSQNNILSSTDFGLFEESVTKNTKVSLNPISIKKEASFWFGSIEKENPFLNWIETKNKEIKSLKKNITRLEEQKVKNNSSEEIDRAPVKRRFHPLAEQNLELRDFLNIPLPKEKKVHKYWEDKLLAEFKEEDALKESKTLKEDVLKKKSSSELKKTSLKDSQNNIFSSIKPRLFEGFFEDEVSLNQAEIKKSDSNQNQTASQINKKESIFALSEEALKNESRQKKKNHTFNDISLKRGLETSENRPAVNERSLKENVSNSSNPLLEKFEMKKKELEKLKAQWEEIQKRNLKKEELLKTAKNFEFKDLKGKILIASFPIEDRKILSALSDSLLSSLSSGLLVIAGKAEKKYPVVASLTKDFQKYFSAGNILKNIVAPLCQGQGGGKASFAQGSITDSFAFLKLEETLLEKIKKSAQ